MEPTQLAACVAGGAALLSSLSALATALRQRRLNRQLTRLHAANIERREFREGLLLLSATSRVVAERGRELGTAARTTADPAQLRTPFEAFTASAEYLLQAWTNFSARVVPGRFDEVRESVAKLLEATEATRLGWLVLSTDGPTSTAQQLAAYAGTASQWSSECQHMCATGAQASGALVGAGS